MTAPLPGDFAVVSAGGTPGRLVQFGEMLNGAGAFDVYQHAFIYIGARPAEPEPPDGLWMKTEPIGQSGESAEAFKRRLARPRPGEEAVIQAEPTGADYARLTPHARTLWSTGKIPLTDGQRDRIVQAAIGYIGTPYSFLDYLALALHHWHIPIPQLKAYVKSTGHMICSQYVDRCYQDAGIQLFKDPPRWNGYVTPSDLAKLIG
jgi:cell wall-associated NlpC family hydrolase